MEHHSNDNTPAPAVVDPAADEDFRRLATAQGRNPDDPWLGGYVPYEWNKGRWMLTAGYFDLTGRDVLEFGCNFGATSVVLAKLGARVVGADIDARTLQLADRNIARYGCGREVSLLRIDESGPLPWPDGRFDAIVANSVLECVRPPLLAGVLRELDRVLARGGALYVLGTSNRLVPREVHSRRWGVNYLPRRLDRLVWPKRREPQRGISPFFITGMLKGYRNLCRMDKDAKYFQARRNMGDSPTKVALLRMAGAAVRWAGLSAGQLTPSICMILQKP